MLGLCWVGVGFVLGNVEKMLLKSAPWGLNLASEVWTWGPICLVKGVSGKCWKMLGLCWENVGLVLGCVGLVLG